MQYELGEDRGVIEGREIFIYGAKDLGDKKTFISRVQIIETHSPSLEPT